jgi:hypothetical protein
MQKIAVQNSIGAARKLKKSYRTFTKKITESPRSLRRLQSNFVTGDSEVSDGVSGVSDGVSGALPELYRFYRNWIQKAAFSDSKPSDT